MTFCIFLISYAGWSQKEVKDVPASSQASNTNVNLQRDIKLERNSDHEEVILNVDEDVEKFELVIISSVDAGHLKIDVYDAQGGKQGTFSMGTQLKSKKSERVSGNINKSWKDPQSGDWKVSITPTDATGTIKIQTRFIY